MEVAKAGCDIIDVGMEPLSWGTGHADLLSVQAMLKDAGYQVPEINMEEELRLAALKPIKRMLEISSQAGL